MTATLRVFCRQMPEKELSIHTILEGMPEKRKREENKAVFLPLNLFVALLLLCVALDRVVDVVKDVVAGTNL